MKQVLLLILLTAIAIPGSAAAQRAQNRLRGALSVRCLDLTIDGAGALPTYRLAFQRIGQRKVAGETLWSITGYQLRTVDNTEHATLATGAAIEVNNELEVTLDSHDISITVGSARLDNADVHLVLDPATLSGTFTAVEEETSAEEVQVINHWTGTVAAVQCPR